MMMMIMLPTSLLLLWWWGFFCVLFWFRWSLVSNRILVLRLNRSSRFCTCPFYSSLSLSYRMHSCQRVKSVVVFCSFASNTQHTNDDKEACIAWFSLHQTKYTRIFSWKFVFVWPCSGFFLSLSLFLCPSTESTVICVWVFKMEDGVRCIGRFALKATNIIVKTEWSKNWLKHSKTFQARQSNHRSNNT